MNVHDTVQRLVPWYVNGTLNEGDMAVVSRHLSSCPNCTADADEEMRQARALAEHDDKRLHVLLSKEQQSFDRLLGSLPEDSSRMPRNNWRPALAAAAALLLAVLVVLRPGPELAPGETLFDAQTSVPHTSPAPVLQVVFHPETPEQDIRALLIESGSELLELHSRRRRGNAGGTSTRRTR